MSNAEPLTFYLAHSAATGNLGDDAMLLNAARRLREWFPDSRLRIPLRPGGTLPDGLPSHEVVADVRHWIELALRATAPLRFGKRWPDPEREGGGRAVTWRRRASDWLARMMATDRGRAARDVRPLASSDILYVTGDNAINDFNPAGVFERLCLLRVARRLGLTTVLSSQGIGPIASAWARDALKEILAQADLVSYRYDGDGTTLSRAIAAANLWQMTTGDEAYSLPPDHEAGADVLERAGVRRGERYLAVHFREPDFTPQHRDLTGYIARVLDDIASRCPDPFVFFPMSISRRYGLDAEYGGRIRQQMAVSARLRIAAGVEHPAVVKAAVAQARLTIGSSYHMHVFGLSQDVPAVIAYSGAYYQAKSDGLAALYAPSTHSLDMKVVDPGEVVDAVERALADTDGVKPLRAANVRLSSVNDSLLRTLADRCQRGSRSRLAPRNLEPSESKPVPEDEPRAAEEMW
jgi:polysaccharide pyruvyl transferase WcaK-like protein